MSTSQTRVDEEDELDDLDDVLDQFSAPAQSASKTASTSTPSQPSKPPNPTADVPAQDALTDDLAAELAKQMETLLTGLGIPPEGAGTDELGTGERERLAAAWEAMLVEEMNAVSAPTTSTSNTRTSTDASTSRQAPLDFQSRLRETMNKRRERESELQPSEPSANAGVNDDMFKSILSQLEGLGDDGQQSEEQIQGVLEAMMGQLLSKDVLYEPLKELHEKFPGYLTEHASTISPQDKARYNAQISCIKQLIDEFETPTYCDDDEKTHEKIVALMTELQSHGQPPEEIMGPLPPGFNLGADGLPEMPDACNMN